MGIISTIKSFFSKHHGKFNATELFKQADATAEYITIVLDAFNNQVYRDAFSAVVTATDARSGKRLFLTGAIYDYVTDTLPPMWTRIQRKDPLAPLIAVMGTIINDLNDIKANYKTFFGSEEIDSEELTTVNALIAGYIQKASYFQDWLGAEVFIFNTYTVDGKPMYPDNPAHVSSYAVGVVKKKAPYVKEMFKEILSRRKGATILSLIDSMRNRGSDVAVKEGSADISQYAEDNSFTPAEVDYIRAGFINPLMWFTKVQAVRAHKRYELNKELREFIKIRIAMAEQAQSGLDPESPEYHKYETICKRYLDKIAKLDKEINQYEI